MNSSEPLVKKEELEAKSEIFRWWLKFSLIVQLHVESVSLRRPAW